MQDTTTQNATQTAEERLTRFANLMNAAGYDMADEMREALLQEFANCAEADEEYGGNDSMATLMDALEYAASHMARDLQ